MFQYPLRSKQFVFFTSKTKHDILINKFKNLLNYYSAPEPEEGNIEIHANSASARTEFSWGFLFWSFMNFGAANALSGVNKIKNNKFFYLTIDQNNKIFY
mgnify:CR=1 FL=1